MAAYIHGNLAVEQKSGQRVKIKETKKVVTRNKTLPVQEKLLYLFTVVVCVFVAGVIIWRYAQIYEMNTRIQQIENEIRQLEAENSVLKHKVEALSDPQRMLQKAKELGLEQAGDKQISRVPAKAPASASAPSGSKVAANTTP
ncbi:cell division protein FtsL [Paenibacillus hamazuiensis]|uniref:cell division protein FtsL n=1 Tax=Paenibacillus hamazuiensis TaxID=2936508 RepID=UPI00200F3B6D|nr:cell division protein FtsL [Paenibacillus hamazuiensis]